MSDTDHLYIKPTADVVWGAPKTIRELIAQLETMDQDIKVHGALHTEFDGKRVARCRYLGMSFERVDAPWIRQGDHDVPYSLVFWTQEDQGVRTPPDVPAPQSNAEAPDALTAGQARIEALEGALKPFEIAANEIEARYGSDLPDRQIQFPELTMGDFRRARSALTQEPRS